MDQSKNAQNAAEPAIRVTQIDGGQLGDVNKSVNLYRGEVNMPLALLSLPGRGGLDVAINAMYSSNVNQQVTTWNMESPTGVLGLGWQLATSRIVVDYGETSAYYDGTFYLIIDGQTQELKQVSKDGDVLTYQTKEMSFSKILFYPKEYRWTVVNESGMTYTFGGGVTANTTGKVLTSPKNLCGFGVAWDNWIGSSTKGGGQMFVKQWNLGSIQNIWGERIEFDYVVTSILIGNEENNLSYTQSMRLKSIIDVNKRKVFLSYKSKSPNEIQLPIITPTNKENAFQFEYETQFLNSIEVQDETGNLLSRIDLDYETKDVMNLGDNFDKRYLTSVTQYNDQGQALPSVQFDYYTNSNDPNPGALKTVCYPQGAIAQYTYDAFTVKVKDKNGNKSNDNQTSITINNPDGYNEPEVWFGSDYTVICWRDKSSNNLKVQIYSWQGQWVKVEETFGQDESIEIDDSSTIEVQTSGEYFTLKFKDTKNEYQLYLFHKHIYKPGIWQYTQAATSSTNAKLQVALGKDFVVYVEKSENDSNRALTFNAYCWNVCTNSWDEGEFSEVLPIQAEHFSVVAKDNYFALLWQKNNYDPNNKDDYEDFRIMLYYQDEMGKFHAGPNSIEIDTKTGVKTAGFEIDKTNDYTTKKWDVMDEERMLAAGNTFVGFTFLWDLGNEYYDHVAGIINWDSTFTITQLLDVFQFDTPALIGYQAPVIRGAVFAAGNQLYRFNGDTWDARTIDDNGVGKMVLNAFGSDTASIGLEDEDTKDKQFDYYSYDYSPYERAWIKTTYSDDYSLPTGQAVYPSVNGNYRVLGNKIWYRNNIWYNNELEWNNIKMLEPSANSTAVAIQNLAPTYIATYEADKDSRIYFLANGACLAPQLFNNTNMRCGYNSIVLFDKDNLAEADSLTLIRFTDNHNFNAAPIVRAVTRLSVDNGGSIIQTTYEFDEDKIIIDPFSRVAQFTHVEAKVIDSLGSNYGKTVSEFFSGQHESLSKLSYDTQDPSVKEHYGLTAGLLYRQEDFKKIANDQYQSVRAVVNIYQVFNDAGNYGAYIRQKETVESTDGVAKRTAYLYNSKRQKSNEIFYYYNAWGENVELHTRTKYAWQVYPQMKDLNLLNETTETRRVEVKNGVETVIDISVNTFKQWEGYYTYPWATYETYRWKGGSNTTFPYGSTPDSNIWLKTSTNYSCNKTGQLEELIDADGVYSTIVYDKNKRFPIANFLNADKTEAFYTGFEAYEDLSESTGWFGLNYDSNKVFVGDTSNSFTGKQSLSIYKGIRAGRRMYPNRINQVFMLGFWIKTPTNFAFDNAQVNFQAGSVSKSIDITPTGGIWQFQTVQIDLTNCGASKGSELKIEFYHQPNSSTAIIMIDNVFFCPALCEYEAVVYGTKYLLQTTTLGIRGEATRMVYDSFQQPIVATDVNGEIIQMTAKYLWRRNTSVISGFNYDTALKIQSESSLYTFMDDKWTDTWNPDYSDEWTIDEAEQQLVCGAGTHGLSFNNWNADNQFALRVQLADVANYWGKFSIVLGTTSIYWNYGTWYFSTVNESAANTSAKISSDCLLVVTDSVISFYADGELLFNTVTTLSSTDKGSLKIETTAALKINALSFGLDPVVSMAYKDSLDNVVQDQVQIGKNCTVVETFYDLSNQAILKTLPKVYESQGFGYKENLVKTFDYKTGQITDGDIDIRYEPAYGGYYFNRKRYEASPLSRLVETGMPGATLAIDPQTDVNSRPTVRVEYGQNVQATYFMRLPSDRYAYTSIKNQDGIQSAQLTDNMDNVIAECRGMENGQFGTSGVTTWRFYDYNGNVVKTIHPNAFKNANGYFVAPATTTTDWTETNVYNSLGQLIRQSSSDMAGESKKAYDKAGRLRFKMLPDAAGSIYYYTYDELGRIIEEGQVFYKTWGECEAGAGNPDFTFTTEVHKRCQYGMVSSTSYYTSANDSHHIGRLTQISTLAEDKVMRYGYDLKGHVIDLATSMTDHEYNSHFGYKYSKHDEILTVWDADKPGDYEVNYAYNGIGRMTSAVLSSKGYKSNVAFTYNKNGNIINQVYDGDKISESFAYETSGWLSGISSPFFDENLYYNGSHSGKITALGNKFNKGINDANFLTDYVYTYQYDNRGQLKVATMLDRPQYSMGTSFDLNGNISSMNAGTTSDFNLKTGNNQIDTVSGRYFSYDELGNVTQSTLSNDMSWGKKSQQPERTTINDGALSFAYDFNNQRIIKEYRDDADGNKFTHAYGLDLHGMPLKRTKTINDDIHDVEYYMYGPKGLLIINQTRKDYQDISSTDSVHYVLKDHLGSIRVVVKKASMEVVAACNYMPFGVKIDLYGDESLCKYRYTGQEFDSETGLYNYKNRTYDPTIARFYNIDPKHQFASPYLYVGNDPILYADFTGEWSAGAIVGLLVGARFVVAGLAVMGASIVAAGLTAATGGLGAPLSMALGATSGALLSAGVSGIAYSISHHDDFSVGKYIAHVAVGAVIGGVTGGLTAGIGSGIGSVTAQIGVKVTEGVIKASTGTALTVGAYVVGGAAMFATGVATSMVQQSADAFIDDGLDAQILTIQTAATAALNGVFNVAGGLVGPDEVSKMFKVGATSFTAKALPFTINCAGVVVVNSASPVLSLAMSE